MTQHRVVLGFDFGTKRIGVAVGQELTCTATALETLKSPDGGPDWSSIRRLIEEWHPDGVFVFIGTSANSGFLPPEIARNRQGFVVTDDTMQTSMTGVFAAGDVRAGATAQIASAAGEGASAALMIRGFLDRVG